MSKHSTAKTLSREVWKPVVGYEGYYEVSSYARVRSTTRMVRNGPGMRIRNGRVVKTFFHQGYRVLTISKNGRMKSHKVSVLMARAFIPNPENKLIVSHINDVRTDDRLENLEWATRKENGERAVQNDRMPKGSRNGTSKLTEEDIPVIRHRAKSGERHADIALDYGIASQTVSEIHTHQRWKHVR